METNPKAIIKSAGILNKDSFKAGFFKRPVNRMRKKIVTEKRARRGIFKYPA